jgi:hypothetical protein
MRFRYQYEGREYEGDRLDFSPGPFGETHARRPGGFTRIRFAYVVLLCFVFPSFAAIGYGIWLKIR